MRRTLVLAFVLCVALAIAGCGSGSSSSSSTSAAGSAPADNGKPAKEAGESNEISRNSKRGVTFGGVEPGIPKPSGPPPKVLVKKAIIPGSGKAAANGDRVTVRFVGFNYKTGKKFNSSWEKGNKPLTFNLGAKEVIPGWDKGVVGMKESGRYELIVPPGLAFGSAGKPPKILPNETLVYLIDIASVS